ncbi:hypothetical protein DUNSADRAFT_73 [Dunaliella salina]|uniref:Encoded protein n=1 Tax=Dunaliella salina TaxID=3046 RepID=A0ABQ7H8T8_DUNSA|nr:hypothetical protein DUNSADRAFT_73 [Dunaliella salina]|eukprot:KAF5843271.1 hypothetical protein DUNSADRAFT_73 [Dunaliella salina]
MIIATCDLKRSYLQNAEAASSLYCQSRLCHSWMLVGMKHLPSHTQTLLHMQTSKLASNTFDQPWLPLACSLSASEQMRNAIGPTHRHVKLSNSILTASLSTNSKHKHLHLC